MSDRRRLGRAGLASIVGQALAVGMTLTSGVIAARALGPDGRGALTAIMTLTALAGYLGAIGANAATSFAVARDPSSATRVLMTWLALAVVLGGAAVGIVELVLPVAFGQLPEEVIQFQRLYALLAITVIAFEAVAGTTSGAGHFVRLAALRLGQPAFAFGGTILLSLTGSLTVESAALAQGTGWSAAIVVGTALLVREHGMANPSAAIARTTLWYGARAHLASLGSIASQRLDLVILPAIVSASAVGQYGVATNIATIPIMLGQTLASIVLSTVAGAESARRRRALSALGLHGTLVVAGTICVALAIVGPFLIRTLYGEEFTLASTALLWLLPGAVCLPAANVLCMAIAAEDRPFTAAVPQILGAAITVVLLLQLLEAGGVIAAAQISSIAYAATLVLAIGLYYWATAAPARTLVPSPRMLRRHLRRVQAG